jgi:hypothetical protein
MPEIVNQRVDVFLGLNNMLNPSSPEYREGMAYRSLRARIGEDGLWAAQQALVGVTSAPDIQTCPHATSGHFKNLAVDDTDKIVMLGLSTYCDVGPNKKLYSTDGSTLKCARGTINSAYTPPAWSTATRLVPADGSAESGRIQDGTYFYMCTYFDNIYKRESLPSQARATTFDNAGSSHTQITINHDTATSDKRVRIYRTKRTNAAEGVRNPINKFYFIAEKTSGVSHVDQLGDDEIKGYEYEGRGTDPYTAMGSSAPDYLCSYNNRMLYFLGNVVYWSSAGRPEEVAAEYDVDFNEDDDGNGGAYTSTIKPKLSIGRYGEAHFEIMELAGHTVKAAALYLGKLYIWTDTLMGYLEATNRLEGYRFKLLREGVGVTSDKVLALSPYGMFGADRQGVWLLTPGGLVHRLSDNVVDLHAGTDTTFSQQNFTDSFGCWSPITQEYLWGVSGKVLAYQANRGAFAGPYSYAVSGGCMISTTGGAQAYLTGGQTPSPTTKDSVAQTLQFWMGQSTPTTIKDQLVVEIVHSLDPSDDVTATVYQNCIASTTGAVSTAATYSEELGRVHATSSGRYFMLQAALPSGGAPIAAINYKFNAIPWSDNHGR